MYFAKLGVSLCLILILGVGLMNVAAQDAQPVSAVDGILAAFDQYPLVAIGETHGVKELGDLYQAIVRAPGFADKADAIVVEFGNAFYQSVIDRYIAGEEIPYEELSHVWRDVVGAGFGSLDAPMYEQFFTAVRDVNQTLPADQRLRVLLGDPAVDWGTVTSAADLDSAMQSRDTYFANVVDTEVMQKGLKALIITGGAHLSRGPAPMIVSFDGAGSTQGAVSPDMPEQPKLMLDILDEKYPDQTYVVQVHTGFIDSQCNTDTESKFAGWSTPALAPVKGTWLEIVQCVAYPMDFMQRFGAPNDAGVTISAPPGGGMIAPPPNAPAQAVISGDVFPPGQAPFPTITADAYVYLGARDSLTMSVPDPAIYTDAYLTELERRRQILRGQPLDRAKLTNRPTRLIDAFPLPAA
jgi:hypothetical protein